MTRWEETWPGVASRVVMVLGLMSQPTESFNIDPTVDFKVYMDMQFQALSTDPILFGLGGIQWYHAAYADEENLRWGAQLFRHYGAVLRRPGRYYVSARTENRKNAVLYAGNEVSRQTGIGCFRLEEFNAAREKMNLQVAERHEKHRLFRKLLNI